ncbi:MAG: DUF368 domain-containing protein [Thermotoga caldifontis]|uniref:DUF368 domain-containing protein n=1 Tax=Thermotoga caldifontis TaxID=1508419 RepID=UPI003C7CCF5B
MLNILRGFLIGLTNLIPGVSGATMAVILGIYEKLIGTVSNLMRFRFTREQILFIATVGTGIVTAIFAGSIGMKKLLEAYPAVAYAIFFGLILGSLPGLFREIGKFRVIHFTIGATLMVAVELMPRAVQLSQTFLFLAGVVAACAMVLPGISGSLILLILGAYGPVIEGVAKLNLSIVVPFGIGVILGIVLMAIIMDWFTKTFPSQTRSFTFGLVVASIFKIEPFTKEQIDFPKLIAILSIVALTSYSSFRLSKRSFWK